MIDRIASRLRAFGDQAADTQFAKGRLMLAALPFMLLFLWAGALPMVAMFAGMAVGLLALGPWIIKIDGMTVRERRGLMIAGAGILAPACGTQVLVWQFGVSDAGATGALFACAIGVVVVFALVELFKWLWRRVAGVARH